MVTGKQTPKGNIETTGTKFNRMKTFKYLGSIVASDDINYVISDIKYRINKQI